MDSCCGPDVDFFVGQVFGHINAGISKSCYFSSSENVIKMEDLETLREREREGISHSVSLLGFLLALRGERCGFICHG